MIQIVNLSYFLDANKKDHLFIKQQLKDRNINFREIASLLNISYSQLYEKLNGKKDATDLVLLLKQMGITLLYDDTKIEDQTKNNLVLTDNIRTKLINYSNKYEFWYSRNVCEKVNEKAKKDFSLKIPY